MNIESLVQRIEECTICKGVGSIEVKVPGGYRIDPCRCALAVQAQKGVLDAGIPAKFQDWDFRNLQKSFKNKNKEALITIKRYVADLPKNIRQGNGMWLSAPSGLNKNAFVCYILKAALEKQKRVYYTKASKLLTQKLDSWKDPEAKYKLKRITDYSDLVAITDIEKINPNNNPNDVRIFAFYEVLSDLDENRIALLISSNMPKGNVVKKTPMFMRQRLRALKEVVLRYANHDNDEDDY